MTVSLYMPDVKVELGFGYGYATPVDDIVWTDVSEYVELAESFAVGFGRGDERSTADANSVSLTLDNTDGRFTARRSASPYYPNVKIGVPIRVTATPVGGTASVRFVGYVDEWPLAWDGTDEYAMAAISATSRLSRLGTTTALRSIVEQEILLDSPLAYYTLGEPEAAAAANDSSARNAAPLAQVAPWLAGTGSAVTFGSAPGPGMDGLTAVQVAGGSFLGAPTASLSAFTVECFVLRSAAPALIEAVLGVGRRNGSTGKLLSVSMKTDGHVAVFGQGMGGGSGSIASGASVADGAYHHIALTMSGTSVEMYVDGESQGTVTLSTGGDTFTGLEVGGSATWLANTLTGSFAHAALYGAVLSASRIAAHAAAGFTGFLGERSDERIVRYASYVGIGPSEIIAETGVPMAAVSTTGAAAVDMMRVCETTEQCVLYDRRDGRLGFNNRGHRYRAATAFTFDFNRQEIESGYQPMFDRSTLLNTVTASNVGGTVTGLATDATSIDDYGVASASVEIATTDTADVARLAKWWVARYAEPKPRVAALTVNLLGFSAADQDAILALTNGDLIDVTNHPTQAADSTASYFVEGVTEDIGDESYMVTFNLSPSEPFTSVLILNDPVRGLLDGSNVLGF